MLMPKSSLTYSPFSFTRSLLKEPGECTFFVHLLDPLNFGIQEDIIQGIIKGVQMYLIYAFAILD